ncbi:phage tail assembly chaperone [Lacrimispora sp.]|uniref:phage tail assembly chaperone n=1 Tax=Lacrimispora sp. TaxID=2719234 RepID=UPI0028A819F3|nr:phage portal protein [Lacrimispora sp.]
MSKLSAFLKPAVASVSKEVVVSDRFLDEKGEPAKITIKGITQEENNRLIKLCTRTQKDKGTVYETLDKVSYQNKLVLACVSAPDFANKEICDAYGVVDPSLVPAKMFLSGEYAKLVDAIMELNGFKDSDELNDEAKNF